ncbi:hypothetical protein JCM10207_008929 [Rhodosporidiobolus poonsookiae]
MPRDRDPPRPRANEGRRRTRAPASGRQGISDADDGWDDVAGAPTYPEAYGEGPRQAAAQGVPPGTYARPPDRRYGASRRPLPPPQPEYSESEDRDSHDELAHQTSRLAIEAPPSRSRTLELRQPPDIASPSPQVFRTSSGSTAARSRSAVQRPPSPDDPDALSFAPPPPLYQHIDDPTYSQPLASGSAYPAAPPSYASRDGNTAGREHVGSLPEYSQGPTRLTFSAAIPCVLFLVLNA